MFAPGGFIVRHHKFGANPHPCAECGEIQSGDGDVYYDHKATHKILCPDCYAKERLNSPEPTKKTYKPKKPVTAGSTEKFFKEEISSRDKDIVQGLKDGLWNDGTDQIKKWKKDKSPGVQFLVNKALSERENQFKAAESQYLYCFTCGEGLLSASHYKEDGRRYCYKCYPRR